MFVIKKEEDMEESQRFNRLVSKRDNLLKQNLNKELKLAKINMEKEMKELNKSKKSPPKEKKEIKVPERILEKENEINIEIIDNKLLKYAA
jgi:hypothetical protein